MGEELLERTAGDALTDGRVEVVEQAVQGVLGVSEGAFEVGVVAAHTTFW